MPRIRTLKPEALQHRKVGRLSDRAFRLWIALITQADDHGRLLFDPGQFQLLVWGYHRAVKQVDVQKALREITQAGLARTYEQAGTWYIYFPSWEDHQRVQHPAPTIYPDPPFYKAAITADVRVALARRYGMKPGSKGHILKCHYCEATTDGGMWWVNSRGEPSGWVTFGEFEMDHAVPESAGGATTEENIVLACRPCNRAKGPRHVPSGTFMNVPERYGGIGSGSGSGSGSERIGTDRDQDATPPDAASLTPPANGPVRFNIPESITRALERAPRLGAAPALRDPAWWQALIRARPGVDMAMEVLKAEAWMTAHPEKRYRKLGAFLHGWIGRAERPEEDP